MGRIINTPRQVRRTIDVIGDERPRGKRLNSMPSSGKTRVLRKNLFQQRNFDPETVKQVEFANTIDIPEDLVEDIEQIVETEAENISRILLIEGLGPILGYLHALEYVGVTLRDGLGKAPPQVDGDVEEVIANALKLRVIEHLLTKIKIHGKYKERYLNFLTKKFTDNLFSTVTRTGLRESSPDSTVGIIKRKSK